MKKIIFALLAFMLVACAAAPTQPPAPLPSPVPPTPQIIVATVLVPVEVTSIPPTSAPANTPLPPPTLAPTEVPTQAATAQAQNVSGPTPTLGAVSGPIAIDPKFNGQSFEKLSVSSDKFSLNCSPKEISFDAYTTDVYIVRTDLYFRIRDKHSTAPEPWALGGTMQTDGGNHFWMTLKGDQIKADLRKAQGWFDFQFVGINKLAQTNDNWHSEKITDLVSYTISCP